MLQYTYTHMLNGGYMNIKKIAQIITLTGLVATGSAHSMQAIAKAAMRWTGNAIGVGIPLQNTLNNKRFFNKEQQDLRDPSETEKQYFDKYITVKNKPVKIQAHTNTCNRSHCGNDSEYLIFPEIYNAMTLEEALKSNNQEALSLCAALAQHKNEHAKKHHYEKFSASTVAIPIVTTSVAAALAYKLYPYNKAVSVTKHMGSMIKKATGGWALAAGNSALIRNIRHEFEHTADLAISEEHKNAFTEDLIEVNGSLNYHTELLEKTAQAGLILSNTEIIKEAMTRRVQLELEKSIMHPPLEERLKRLHQKEPKNIIERIAREFKVI